VLLTLFPVALLAMGISNDGVDASDDGTGDDNVPPDFAIHIFRCEVDLLNCPSCPKAPESDLGRTGGRLGLGTAGKFLYTLDSFGLGCAWLSLDFRSSFLLTTIGTDPRSSLCDISAAKSAFPRAKVGFDGILGDLDTLGKSAVSSIDGRSLEPY
jgi:hypothetical protein